MNRYLSSLTIKLLGLIPLAGSAQVLPSPEVSGAVVTTEQTGRFSEEELALFRATTAPFLLSGIPVDPGNSRSSALAPFIDHTEPAYREMARATRDLLALNQMAGGEPTRVDSEIGNLSGQWKGFITDSAFENPGGGPDVVRRRRLEILAADLGRIVRARATELGGRKEGILSTVSGAMELSMKEAGGYIHLQIRNRTSRAWNHVILTARRVQDREKLPESGDDEVISGELIKLIGISEELIPTGDKQIQLLEKFQTAEHGAFVYAPEIGPGATVSFIVAPFENLEYTKAIEVSMWSDEGQELRLKANGATLLERQVPDADTEKTETSSVTGTGPDKRPPLGSGSRLHGAKGLDGAKGLNGASLEGAKGLEGAK